MSFSKDMILHSIRKWAEDKIRIQWVIKPTMSCVRCMASFWGAVTFWPIIIFLFEFSLYQIFVFIADVFILVYLNFIYYKKA